MSIDKILIFSFVFIEPQPAFASIEGEECSIWWVDPLNGWVHVDTTWVDSCPISCFGDVAGDINTGATWCSGAVPPPNYPGADLGAMCSAEDSRTVNLLIGGTLGETFEMNGNGQIVSGISFTFTSIPEGIFNLQTQATNSGGSSGWSPIYSAQHDYSAPTTTANFVGLTGENGWYTSPVSVSFTANDAGCFGVSQTAYAINGGTLTNYFGVPFTIPDDGEYTLQYRSTDGHHPEAEKLASIKIDSLVPTLLFLPDRPQDVSGWWQAPLNIGILADDATSGLASLEYNLNGSGWVAGDFVSLTDGIYSLDAQATDNAGHLTYDGIMVQIDSLAPILDVTITGENGENGWFIAPPSVFLSATDTTSGLAGILYQVDGGSQTVYIAPLRFTREGLYTMQAYAVDYAQHITTRTFQVGYDITPPQTNIALDETENGMTITLNRWDGVSGFALTRMAINGVWQDYHAPITISEKGEYWVQYFTTDFAGNIESEKIANFTIADDVITVVQVPPVENNAPPMIPPNTPPFETADDFPPTLGEGNIYIFTPPPDFSDDSRISNNGEGQHTTNTNTTTLSDNPRISRPPFIREGGEGELFSDIFPLEAHTPPQKNPVRVSPIEYVEHPVAFVPTENTVITDTYTEATEGANNPENAPLDVTMLAMLGLTIAGAGIMKSESAIAKQKEQEAKKAEELANLQAQQSVQKADASANWEENLAMQAEANLDVVVGVKQSQANKNYWAAYALWKAQVALVEAKKRTQALAKKKPIIISKSLNPRNKSTTSTSGKINPLALVLSVIIVGTGLLLGTVQSQPSTKPEDFEKPPKESQAGSECYRQLAQFPGMFDEAFCTVVSTAEALININELGQSISDVISSFGWGSSSDVDPLEEQVTEWTPFSDMMTEDLVRVTTPDPEEPLQYYFRGTTEGYAGNSASQTIPSTSTSTQPGIATVFATEAETTHGRNRGVVYIASSDDLEGVPIGDPNHFEHYEFEVAFTITPLDFAQLAGICIRASEARRILNSMDIDDMDISSLIFSDELSEKLESLPPLNEFQIAWFVFSAMASPRC